MPGKGRRSFDCVVCSKRTKPSNRRPINPAIKQILGKKFMIETKPDDVICDKCRQRHTVTPPKKKECHVEPETEPAYELSQARPRNISSPPSVSLKLPSTPRSHARCIVCKKPGPKLIVISAEARFHAFIESNVLISAGTRCCPGHLETDNKLKTDSLVNMTTTDHAMVNRTSILKLLSQMRAAILQRGTGIDWENISDADCQNLTGISRDQFDDLCGHVIQKIKSSPSRSPKASVGVFLFKMKSGISNKLMSTILQISCSSVRRAVKTVRSALMESFVPLHLGLESITREEINQYHTRPLARELFSVEEGALILILDGTYIYVQKSNNFAFQRKSFSAHKSRALIKPMVVVTTTGHFVTIVGPYLAKDSDAKILQHMINNNVQDFKDFLQEKDLLVVDRGFRDSLSLLGDLGIRAAMPTFLLKGQKQMTTEDANNSRLVTKIRWVVESANARIKRYKFLDKVLPTNQVPYIGDYVRIICAISNKYLPQLSSSQQQQQDVVLAAQMKERAQQVNSLRDFVEENHLERRSTKWRTVEDSNLQHFPRLSEEELRELTCGVYQLRLSASYIQEHLDGDCDIHIHVEEGDLIRVRIQSRHVSARKYCLWIRFSACSILAWYCKCRAGSRVVGVCAHIAAVVWYLSHGRYQTGCPGVRDWGACISDVDRQDTIDVSDSDSCMSFVEE